MKKEQTQPNLLETIKAANDQTLAAITEMNQEFIKAVEAFLKSVPAADAFATFEFPKFELPATWTAPAAPSPRELVETSFGFAEQYLASQKAFATKLVSLSEV